MRRSARVFLIVVLAAIVIGAAVVVVMLLRAGLGSSPLQQTPSSRPVSSSPVYTPSSAGPMSTVAPSPIATDRVEPEPTPGGPATATIVNAGADQQDVFASGLVTGEAGDGGTCTLTATSAQGQAVSASTDAHATPSAINCGVIRIPVPSGAWTLVLGFHSASIDVSSAPTKVVRP